MSAEKEQGEGVVLVRGVLVARGRRHELVWRHPSGGGLFAAPACRADACYAGRRNQSEFGLRFGAFLTRS